MINPVLYREMRTSLRTWKTFIAVAAYVLLLTIVAGCALLMASGSYYNGFNPKNVTSIYIFMTGFQLGLIILIVPALTGGAISGERERQTLDLMLVTKMSTFSIITGKLISSLMVVLLMLVASIPVFSVILYYGGVSLPELFITFGFLMCSACMVGSVSIFFSSIFKRTIISIVMTYIVMLVLSLGTLIGVIFVAAMLYTYTNISGFPEFISIAWSSINPFVGFLAVMDAQLGNEDILNGIMSRFYYRGIGTNIAISPWIFNVTFDMILSAVLLFASAWIVKPIRGGKNENKKYIKRLKASQKEADNRTDGQ